MKTLKLAAIAVLLTFGATTFAQEEHKVNYVKGIITEVLAKNGRLVVRGEDTTMGRPMEVIMDVVILSVGMEPSAGTRTMADLLGLPGSIRDPEELRTHGIFLTGGQIAVIDDLQDRASPPAESGAFPDPARLSSIHP